ncbi:MAG: UDP-N-acetylmuramoyl-L-alanine--D-glutamate ligase [Piscinibacter sp.]|nr:UDP-N-acetylmuramoyl-L-alanine--D-glutamate ligase [Piscinibacter sp.]
MKHLHDIDVLVLGLGDSGLAMARWCAAHGARVRVWDSREQAPQDDALAEHVPAAQRLRGELGDEAFAGVRLVLKSPGLAPGDPRIAAPLARAAETGTLVQGELELFVRALADLKAERGYAPKLLAVTGTNGKTTTTAMTALLVERAGRSVASAGNIGPTMLQTLADRLAAADGDAADALPQVWVLELSSFQLDEAKGFEPDAATVLNLSEDHLDWHGSMAAYVAAKARVFGAHAVMVINRDDPAVEKLVPAPVLPKGRHAKPIERTVVRFGLDAPRRPGDFGLVSDGGMAWLVRAMVSDETARRARDEDEELHIQRLMPADALRVRGRHNAANALAALALACAIGCPLAPMLHGLREYGGEPHRVEHIATLGGVDAFDDSKGTNVGATVAALDGLGADRAPAKLVVILGGDGKGQDFTPLAAPVARHARAIATIGRDAARIEQVLAGAGLPLQRHETLEAAVAWCFEQARPGDAVLLSPACASLDMFRHYGHRAEVFVAAVRSLAADHGEVL